MKRRISQHLRVAFYVATAVGLCGPVYAEDRAEPIEKAQEKAKAPSKETQDIVSFQETLERTYMQNTDLDAARAGLRATDEDVSQANADWRPSLRVEGTQTLNQVYPLGGGVRRDHTSSTGYRASINQNVYRGGGSVAELGQAESSVLAGRAGLFNTEQESLLKGVQSHTSVLANEDKYNYRKRAEEFYQQNVQRTQVRFEVGEGSRTDVAAMEAAYEEAKANTASTLSDLESSKASYLRQVGSVPGKLGKATILLPLPKTYDEALEAAKQNNPTIKEARYRLEAAQYNVDSQIAGLLPTLDVNAFVGNSRNESTNTQGRRVHPKRTDLGFEAAVGIPLYLQGKPNSKIRQAYQQVAQSKVAYVGAQRQVVEGVNVAWNNLNAARENVKSLMASIKAQELAVEGAMEEASVGTKNYIDVLELQKDLIDTQIRLADAQQQLITNSYAVLQSMGLLTAKDLKLDVKYYDPDAYYNEYKNAWIQFWQGKDYRYVKDEDLP